MKYEPDIGKKGSHDIHFKILHNIKKRNECN